MADNNKESGAVSAVVTEDDLLKSIKSLEAKAEEPEKEPEPEVKTTGLEKTAAETVKEGASDKLKKALDVSDTLTEIAGLLGSHVDNALEGFSKSVQGSAERDLAFVRVLTDLKKSIEDLTTKVEAYGDAPADPASKKIPDVKSSEVLNKATGAEAEKKEVDPQILRKQISGGLERLAKKADPSSAEAVRYINAAVKYESTGQIDDITLAEVRDLYKTAA